MKNSIKNSFDKVVPDETAKQRMYDNIVKNKNRAGKANIAKIALIAACVVLAAMLCMQIITMINEGSSGIIPIENNPVTNAPIDSVTNLFDTKVAYKIIMSINPTVEFSVNKDDYVIEVVGLNEDGAELIEGIDFQGLSLENATIVVVNQLLREGYINARQVQNEIQLYFSQNDHPLDALDAMSNIVDAAAGHYNLNTTQETLDNNGLTIYMGRDDAGNELETEVDADTVYSLELEFIMEPYDAPEYVGNVFITPNEGQPFDTFIDFAGSSIKRAALYAFQELCQKNYIRDDVELVFIVEGITQEEKQDLVDFIALMIEEQGLALSLAYNSEGHIVALPTGEDIVKPEYKYTIFDLMSGDIIKEKEDAAPIQMQILGEVFTQEEIDWDFTPRYWAVVPNFIGMEIDDALELLELTGFEVSLEEIIDENDGYSDKMIGKVVYQDTNPSGTWEVGSRFHLSVLLYTAPNAATTEPRENTPTPCITAQVLYNTEGTFYELTGIESADDVSYITCDNIREGIQFEISPTEQKARDIINCFDKLYFAIPEDGDMEYVAEHIFNLQMISDGFSYYADIYMIDDSTYICNFESRLGAVTVQTGNEEIKGIAALLYEICPEPPEKLSDDEVISRMYDMVLQSIDAPPESIEGHRFKFISHQYRLDHMTKDGMDDEFMREWGGCEIDIAHDDYVSIMRGIKDSFAVSSGQLISVADDFEVRNTAFSIYARFDSLNMIQLYGYKNALYMRCKFEDDWYKIKIDDISLLNDFIKLLDEDAEVFAWDKVENVESISIFYVENKYLKDYPENRRLTEYVIDNSDDVNAIVECLNANTQFENAGKTGGDADMILHTANGDIFIKICNPFETNEHQKECLLNTPLLIADGYFWYNCRELYEILFDIIE